MSKCNCLLCQIENQPQSFAEFLLDTGMMVIKNQTVEIIDTCNEASEFDHGKAMARVKMSIDFFRQSTVFKFRAMCEDWDQQRIVSEMY